MKTFSRSESAYKRKITKLESKIECLSEKHRTSSALLRKSNRKIRDLTKSRAKLREKNNAKSNQIKYLRKSSGSGAPAPRHHYPLSLVNLCVQLRVYAGCSYRGICKILLLLQLCGLLELSRIPCANSIENWVGKLGYNCLRDVGQGLDNQSYCLIMDESIKCGNERTLLMLLAPAQKVGDSALRYEDVEILYLGGKSSWTGEKIEQQVRHLVAEKGLKIAYGLSDQDSKLLKAYRLLGYDHLPDINHALGSCLRRVFEKEPSYQALVKQVSAYQSKSVNQPLSYLRPDRQRAKARFLNQKTMVSWGLTLLEKFEELNEKETSFFSELPQYEPFLLLLDQCLSMVEAIAKIFKTQGLSHQSLQAVELIYLQGQFDLYFAPLIQQDNLPSTVRFNQSQQQLAGLSEAYREIFCQFLAQIKAYLDQYQAFLNQHQGIFQLSSDIIESLFGKYKSFCATNSLTGVSLLDLELPLHTLELQEIQSSLKEALTHTRNKDLIQWRAEHSSTNQAKQRRTFFQKAS